MSIFWTFSTWFGDGSGQFWWDTHVPETVPRFYTKRVCCKKYHPTLYDLNETFLQWSKFLFCLSDLRRSQAGQICLHEAIDYSVSNCFINIKMINIIINVETNFRHANHLAAFVSGRPLQFHIPKFHHIPVTSWCLLPYDLVNTS